MKALRILHIGWVAFLALVWSLPWFLQGHADAANKVMGAFILVQLVAAVGIIGNLRVAWWACLIFSGLWFLMSLLSLIAVPVLFIDAVPSHRNWTTFMLSMGVFFLVMFVPSVLSMWLYFRHRSELFPGLLVDTRAT